eukprot:PITA_03989
MPDIDTSIVVHEIPTYPVAKPVRQRLRPVHPRKAAAIKAEVEKLLKAGFIYPIPLTDWVLNIVPVDKKQSEIYSFTDGFSGYNQINIAPADQHKTAFIYPWGTFAYKKLPFGLKNVGTTFQRVMSYAFHDIRRIVQPYLDDLPAHSAKRADHPSHLPEESFAHLKTLLVSAPLLRPPNYHRDYTLYLATADTTIGMVLVQDDEDGIEHVNYYLSRNLLDTETRYAYVEKLALATVCAVQRFRHYILLRTTTLISDCNPMTYILLRQLLGGKYSKWIFILQEFDLEFTAAKSKKSLVFTEPLCSLPSATTSSQIEESIPDETLFLISTLDPWYGDIIVYL